MKRAVFFDRDGVINERILGGYVTKWDEFVWLPDVGETLLAIKEKGYLAIIISNQRGVGTGLMTQEALDVLHERMQSELLDTFGTTFDDIFYCTDANDNSTRRKPSPEMIFEAAVKWNIDLALSWFVGDSPSDIEAGRKAGTRTAFLLNDHEIAPQTATITLRRLAEFSAHLS
ncbi:MAG TPA: HAD family hydrolase [Candidatus Kapabacteria bacterium]|nr:HAD family hydrolase [Candidatus Kapabacteria bacterium]